MRSNALEVDQIGTDTLGVAEEGTQRDGIGLTDVIEMLRAELHAYAGHEVTAVSSPIMSAQSLPNVELLSKVQPSEHHARLSAAEVPLERRLQVAKSGLESLVADPELRRRCADLLAADEHFDRVIREACVVLEDGL